MGPSNIKWWKQPLPGHCLCCSCNDSPFGAAWGEWWTPSTLQGEDSEMPHWFPWGEPPGGWRTLSKMGIGQREEEICVSSTALAASSCSVCTTKPPSLLCHCRHGTHFYFRNKLAYMEKRLLVMYRSICVFLPLIPVGPTSQDQAKGAGGVPAGITPLELHGAGPWARKASRHHAR